jgi:hypothetical protein
MLRARPLPERLYPYYLARYRAIWAAVRRCEVEALRAAELELATLSPIERRVVAMAVHDVAAKLPLRAKVHFVRAFAEG